MILLPEFGYARPASVANAVQLLQSPGARVLAGGPTLVNVLKLRAIAADVLRDVTRLRELRTIERTDAGLELGAAVTYQELVETEDVRSVRPAVAERGVDHRRPAGSQPRHDWRRRPQLCHEPLPASSRRRRARFTILGPAGIQLELLECGVLGERTPE